VSAPDPPDIFGNYLLGDEFVEVVSPAAVSWLPQTVGWAWLGLILLALLLGYGWQRLRRWYRNRYRREAIARLVRLDGSGPMGNWLVELNKLLKLTALAGFPRERVARLSGEEWIDFLNRQCAEPPFSSEQRQLLANGIYRATVPGEDTRRELLEASLTWVRTHEDPHRV
jgi:hypothetical protein